VASSVRKSTFLNTLFFKGGSLPLGRSKGDDRPRRKRKISRALIGASNIRKKKEKIVTRRGRVRRTEGKRRYNARSGWKQNDSKGEGCLL